MTRRRWIADEVHGDIAVLTGKHAAHLSRVLRAQIGQEFDIATGDAVRRGQVTSISAERVEFALGRELVVQPAANVTLVLALFKFDRMEWAIEKCTEIGVARIIPLVARRTEPHLVSAAGKRQERWQRIARQAAEQSRRTAPPEILAPIQLRELNSVGASPAVRDAARIVLAETEQERRLRDLLQAQAAQVALAIGPEGGWTDDELRWFRESGWISASLGTTILRAETAAIVATALALDTLR